jgi:adenosylhomocysteine nucleosidase
VKLDTVPRTALLTAFPPEWDVLVHRIAHEAVFEIAGRQYICGELAGRAIVIAMSGMSMVNAAMTAQAAIDHFAVEQLVYTGIAGAIDPEVRIGDVIVPERWAQSLEVIFGRATAEGFEKPAWLTWAAPLPAFGMMLPNKVVVGAKDGPVSPRLWFPVDEGLAKIARSLEALALVDRTPEGRTLGHRPRLHVGGSAVSASAFVDNLDYRRYLFRTFEARIADMESAAAAQVAFANGVPFIAFRSASDLAGADDQANEMDVFMHLAAENSVRVVLAFLERIA